MKGIKSPQKERFIYNYRIKNFLVKYFNYPPEHYLVQKHYLVQIYEEWEKKLVLEIWNVLVNGFYLLISLFWIVSAFRLYFRVWLWIELPIDLISLGFFSITFQETYLFCRKKYLEE